MTLYPVSTLFPQKSEYCRLDRPAAQAKIPGCGEGAEGLLDDSSALDLELAVAVTLAHGISLKTEVGQGGFVEIPVEVAIDGAIEYRHVSFGVCFERDKHEFDPDEFRENGACVIAFALFRELRCLVELCFYFGHFANCCHFVTFESWFR